MMRRMGRTGVEGRSELVQVVGSLKGSWLLAVCQFLSFSVPDNSPSFCQ